MKNLPLSRNNRKMKDKEKKNVYSRGLCSKHRLINITTNPFLLNNKTRLQGLHKYKTINLLLKMKQKS